MSSFNYDSYHEGDFEDRGEIIWDENDWQKYLSETLREVKRVREEYLGICRRSGVGDLSGPLVQLYYKDEESEDEVSEAEMFAEMYTHHRHPLNMLSQAVFSYIKDIWEDLVTRSPGEVSSVMSINFLKAVYSCEQHVTFASFALDDYDGALVICHLRNALYQHNEAMKVVQQLHLTDKRFMKAVKGALAKPLFDLRELWLRVITDCRETTAAEEE